ncbi:MAG TPA: sugar ABC transporter substrate-binding protein [Oscillatoriaceae cyanobacterium]
MSHARVLAAVALLLLAGCARRAPHGKTVEFWTMQLKPTFTGYIQGMLDAWQARHPGIKVDWVDLPASEIEDKTLTAAASGQPPDLVNLNPSFSSKLANADALLPLTLPAAVRDGYVKSGIDANTFEGRLIGLPWYLSTSITLYNTQVWRKAGLPLGRWPHTYTELAADSRQIKARTGALGFVPTFGDRGKFMELLAAEGVALLTPDGRRAAFDTPQGVGVLAFWAGLMHDGIVPQESLTLDHRDAIDRFQSGQTAALPAGPQFLRIIQQNSPQLYKDLALGPQIIGASGKLDVGVMNLVILRSSPHPKLALDLAEFVTDGPNQLAFAKLVPILPSIRADLRDPYFRPTGGDLPTRARALAAEQLLHASLLVPPLPHEAELARSLDGALSRAALGRQSPAQALEQAAKEWDNLLASP